METRQPAVAQPAGCCVSNKYGATWGSRGELRCPLQRASPHAHVLSDHVHRASCARVCRSSNQPDAVVDDTCGTAHRACYHGVESRPRQVLAEVSTEMRSDRLSSPPACDLAAVAAARARCCHLPTRADIRLPRLWFGGRRQCAKCKSGRSLAHFGFVYLSLYCASEVCVSLSRATSSRLSIGARKPS